MMLRILFGIICVLLGVFGHSSEFEKSLGLAISNISSKNYLEALNVLNSIVPKSIEESRKYNFYKGKTYYLLEDFQRALESFKKVLEYKTNDFLFASSLYDCISISFLENNYENVREYSETYLSEIGDIYGLEANVLYMYGNALINTDRFSTFSYIKSKYSKKYPNIISLLEKEESSKEEIRKKKEYEILQIRETLKNIDSKIEKILKKNDEEYTRLLAILEILQLKEETLKLKKYKLILDE